MTTNPFITDHFTAEEAENLVKMALPLMDSNGRIPWAKVEADTGIGYSRGWLIVRWAFLKKNAPQLLIDWQTPYLKAREQAEAAGKLVDFEAKEVNVKGEAIPGALTNGERRVMAPMVHKLRDVNALSWGEIAVRMGVPESRIRKFYRASGNKKDRGLRIGKGGKFVYGDPTLYLDNRKFEGAQIPVDFKGRPKPEQLLNFEKKASAKKAAVKAS